MRVALLTMLEASGPATVQARAFLPVGGLSVARQQLGLALALGSERIICLARELGPELLELQHVAENSGAHFHAIAVPRALAGLVTAADDLIALADGLLADPEEASRKLQTGPCVLVQPVDAGIAAGFERLDINHASAGALRMPGRLVERIADLPPDVDAVSALTRIALQNGVPQRPIEVAEASARRWALVRNDDEAHALEPIWLAERMGAARTIAPGDWLARWIARRFGPAILHSAGGRRGGMAAAPLLAVLGLGAGWFGFAAAGLVVCGLGWIAGRVADELDRVERRALLQSPPRFSFDAILGSAIDLALIVLAGWGPVPAFGVPWGLQYFAPAMVVALSRIVPKLTASRWLKCLDDRAAIAFLLAAVLASGLTVPLMHGIAVALALAGLLLPRGNRG